MATFRGILYQHQNHEIKIQITLNLGLFGPYQTECVIENELYQVIVRGKTILFAEQIYNFYVDVVDDEILVVGKEYMGVMGTLKQILFPCCVKQSFFLLTNKGQV